jgi:hypothetical protein
MTEDSIPKKKFTATFEFEAIPYNKETYFLLGESFCEDFPIDVYAKQDVGDLIQKALFGNAFSTMEKYPKQHKRFMTFLDQVSNSIKIQEKA